jgi:hypothetical protein
MSLYRSSLDCSFGLYLCAMSVRISHCGRCFCLEDLRRRRRPPTMLVHICFCENRTEAWLILTLISRWHSIKDNNNEEMMLNKMWHGDSLIEWIQAKTRLRGTKRRWRTSRWLVDRGTMAKVKKRILARCWRTNQIMKETYSDEDHNIRRRDLKSSVSFICNDMIQIIWHGGC